MDAEKLKEGMAYVENIYKGEDSHVLLDKELLKQKFNLDGKDICDFGCGMGGMSLWFADTWQCQVTGLDIDKNHLEIAKMLQAKYGQKNVEFIEHNIVDEPLGKKFDLITMNDVAEHIEIGTLQKILVAIKDHLKDDGSLFISYPPWEGPWAGHLNKVKAVPWVHFWPKKQLMKFIESVNHENVGRNDVLEDYLELNHLTHPKLTKLTKGAGFKQSFRTSHTKLNKLSWFKNVNLTMFPFKYLISKELLIFKKED